MYDNKKNINQTHLKMPMLNMNNVPSVENNSGVEENHAKKRLVFKLKKESVNNNMIVPSRNQIEAEKDDRIDDNGKNISLININNYNQIYTNETSGTDVPAPAPSVAMNTKPKIGLKKMPKSEESAKVQCNETNDRDKLNEYYYRHREQKLEYQKKYNKERGEIIKDYNKDYYMKQREKILAKAKTKVMCECGCEVQLFNMNCHKKTKKHIRLVEAKVALLAASASTDAIASN
jgi:hypothetical protein